MYNSIRVYHTQCFQVISQCTLGDILGVYEGSLWSIPKFHLE